MTELLLEQRSPKVHLPSCNLSSFPSNPPSLPLQRHRHQPSPYLEQALLFDSLAAIAEAPEDDSAELSSSDLSTAHPSSCPPSASNSPPMHRASSAPSSRRGSGRRRKSSGKRISAVKPLGRKPSVKATGQPTEQVKREIHNVSERQRRQVSPRSMG